MKLFIIGNGFDLAHGIKSKYTDFEIYLEQNQPSFFASLNQATNNDAQIWYDFENSISKCAIETDDTGLQIALDRINEIDYEPLDDEGLQYWSKDMLQFIMQLSSVLRNWITSVDINKPKAYNKDYFKKEDLYLSFNYTNTLEDIYHIPKNHIIHVHGDAAKPDDKLILGHRDTITMRNIEKLYNDASSTYNIPVATVHKYCLNFLKRTYKPIENIIEKNTNFFERLNNVEEIVVIGSSLSSIDFPYFEYINKLSSFKWTIVYHNPNTEQKLNEKNKAQKFVDSLNIPNDRYNLIPNSELLICNEKKKNEFK